MQAVYCKKAGLPAAELVVRLKLQLETLATGPSEAWLDQWDGRVHGASRRDTAARAVEENRTSATSAVLDSGELVIRQKS